MREYKLLVLLCIVMILSLCGGGCTLVSEIAPWTSPSATPTPASIPASTQSPAPPTPPVPITELPAPTVETTPVITTEGDNEIGPVPEITKNEEPSSGSQENQGEIEASADDELSVPLESADEDEVADYNDEVTESDETSNEKTVTYSTPAPDLIVEKITWSPTNPSIGEKVTFSVTIKNQGTDRADYSHVAYYIDDTYQDSVYVNQINAGAAVTKDFTFAAQAGSHAIKAVADYKDEVTESDEANNAEMFVFSTLGPDLIIQDITWSPASPSIRDTVTFTVTIKNQGTSKAVSSRVYFYIDGSARGYQDVQRIDADATVTKTFPWIAQAGSHALKAVADGLNQVTEGDETNNEKVVDYSTPAPDLIIEAITWSPANPKEGDEVTVTVTMKNQGSGKADYSHVAYYIYYVDDTYQTSVYVNQIDAGATVTKTFNWTVVAGSNVIKAVADCHEKVAESDETNNEKTITYSTLGPDLLVQDITWSPSSPLIGDEVTFTVIIKNQGGTRTDPSHVSFYVDGLSRGYDSVPEIDAGATITKTFTWAAQTGSHTIKAIVDAESLITESNEGNNEKTVTFSGVSLSDLIVQDVSVTPASPFVGDTITLTVTIKNQGAGTSNRSRVSYYIDGTYQAFEYVNQIAPGGTATKTFTWAAQAGSHTIKAVANSHKEVTESDDTNNEKTTTFSTLAPDLIIQDITWSPASPSAGETVTITVSIKNQGGDGVGYSLVGFYIDGSFTGYQDVPEIDAGATATATFTWIAQPGSHTIKAIADMESRVTESDENNNEKTVTLSVFIPAND